MKRNFMALGLSVASACLLLPAMASADSPTSTTAITPLCVLTPGSSATVKSDFAAGMSAGSICSLEGLPGALGASSLSLGGATPDASVGPQCGTVSDPINPDTPDNTHFKESPKVEAEDGIWISGSVTAYWGNVNNESANNYTWSYSFTTDEDVDRTPNSGRGELGAYASTYDDFQPDEGDAEICTGVTNPSVWIN